MSQVEYRNINLMGFAVLLSLRKKIIFAFSLAGLILAAIAAYGIKPRYDATVRFLPPTNRAISPLSLLPSRNLGDQYLGLTGSRTVADDVIEHQHLVGYFHVKKISEARRQLSVISKIDDDKDQFITVRVRTTEPQKAMDIANEYVAALYRLNQSISSTEAAHRREFFEGPLEQEKNKLAEAEEDLKRAQQNTGMVMPEAQVRLGVNAVADIKQQIALREVQLAALRAGSTEQNPRVVELKSQIANLYGQLDRMQYQTGKGASASTAQLPELTMEVERKAREVKYHEALFGILSRQYENARVDQSYTPPIELVDSAVLPDVKSWPPRKIFMLGGLIGGALLGVLYVILQAVAPFRRWKRLLSQYQEVAKTDVFIK
jgi:capsule polysaccharide export protein KpsE/RkpR